MTVFVIHHFFMERLGDYWSSGAKIVWIVYPTQRLVYVYQALHDVRILGEKDALDGGSVLPGLRAAVAGRTRARTSGTHPP